MFNQDRDKSEEMIDAILYESDLPITTQKLIKSIFHKQQEIIIALEDITRNQGYRHQYIEKRLDGLLEKVDPEEAENRIKNQSCSESAGIRIPSSYLI